MTKLREAEEQNKSIGWVVGMLVLTVAYFGWGFLAADYYQNDPSGEGGRTSFWVNTVAPTAQLPERDEILLSESVLDDRVDRRCRGRSPDPWGSAAETEERELWSK